ncbi:dipeptide/oligopeptide/nickel ABC transporter permease/ATP-binding protein [Streptomyces sp. NBC_00316]|uniref:dipeptide/oligopeptide/nickel ABC transporter permease/ATP-binding protein n=1 Tax=Streptomyces sp. NBC_00316 TaxID=2975710 RepID=UPI003FA7B7B6
MVLGTVLGAAAGYFGGKVDMVISRVMDLFLAFPHLLLVLSLTPIMQSRPRGTALDSGSLVPIASLVIILGFFGWAYLARIVRGQVLSIRQQEFVEAAQAYGASHRSIVLRQITEAQMRAYRGKKIAMIFQDPLSAMHPFHPVGVQIAEAYRVHNDVSRKAAARVAVDMLGRVGIPDPSRRYSACPHEFSGGMRQRAMIAMALVCEPELLIADEPTTAPDVTVQAQILDLLNELQDETGTSVILVTHDLGVVAEVCHQVVVMYGGGCVEQATVADLFGDPRHPYTLGLLASMPALASRTERLNPIPGFPPSLLALPEGCLFEDRCPKAHLVPDNACGTRRPTLIGPDGHASRCHLETLQPTGVVVR